MAHIHVQTRVIQQTIWLQAEGGVCGASKTGKQVSPWHDIPLRAEGGLLNAIIEIPKESSPKLEVATVRSSPVVTTSFHQGPWCCCSCV